MPIDLRTTVGVIGSEGRMGSFLTRLVREKGLEVLVADKERGDVALLARCSDIIILSIPLYALEDLLGSIGGLIRKEALLMDIVSTKTRPLEIMLRKTSCNVVAAHPLFGPESFGEDGLKVILCPGRGNESLELARSFWETLGLQVHISTAKEHDRIMGLVQGVFHGVIFSMAECMAKMRPFEREQLKEQMTFNFRFMEKRIEALLLQPYFLYETIFFDNPFALSNIEAFIDSLNQLKNYIKTNDRECFRKRLHKIKEVLSHEGSLGQDRKL